MGLAGLAVALREPAEPTTTQGPGAHALWMFVADLFAGAVPVLPFALLPIEDARMALDRDHRESAGGTGDRLTAWS